MHDNFFFEITKYVMIIFTPLRLLQCVIDAHFLAIAVNEMRWAYLPHVVVYIFEWKIAGYLLKHI